MRRILVTFAAGLLVGGGVTALFTARDVEALRVRMATAQLDLEERTKEIRRLQDQLSVAQKKVLPVIQSVDVTVQGLSGPEAVAVRRAVVSILSALPGLDVRRVDPLLFKDLLDGRLVAAGGNLYRLELKSAVIAPDIHLTVVAHPLP